MIFRLRIKIDGAEFVYLLSYLLFVYVCYVVYVCVFEYVQPIM